MTLSPTSPATLHPVTPPVTQDYYRDVWGVYGGKVKMTMSPLFNKSLEPVNPTWEGPWTPPEDDEKFCSVGNLEKSPVTAVVNLLKKEFPGAKCVQLLLNVQTHLSSSNAVLMLIYLRKLQEKGAFQNGLTFEDNLALFMSALTMNEDYAPDNYQYARILKNKHMLEDSDFIQKCMRRWSVEGEVDLSFYEVRILQFKLADMIDYKLVVSETEYKAVLEEAANLERVLPLERNRTIV
jgi:hypothetical protein